MNTNPDISKLKKLFPNFKLTKKRKQIIRTLSQTKPILTKELIDQTGVSKRTISELKKLNIINSMEVSSDISLPEFKVLRNSNEIVLQVKPKVVKSEDSLGNKVNKKIIGIKISPLNNEFNREKLGPATALFYAVKETWFVTQASLDFIISMFKGKGDTTQLGGPIKIAKITGQVAQHGFIAFLSVMAYISISLGFINLFPIPMLDGGHLMFYAFEKILGRPLTQRTQEGFFRIGLFLLISLMFFTTFNDLKDLGLF